ncbi:MAG: SET domain-containing protein [Anaerolineales bacterium]|nr:SET domain-containing protein [Anaerolineales bacterium]
MDIYIKETNYHIGKGVFAARNFKKGELVLRVTGEVLPYQTIYSIQIDWGRHLDPDPPAKYLNHSCEPTTGVRSLPNGWPEFVALRDIQKDEEITFDYAMTEYCHYPRSDPGLEFELTCHCPAPGCRGRLGYYSELSQELKDKYKGFFAAYLIRNGRPPGEVNPNPDGRCSQGEKHER